MTVTAPTWSFEELHTFLVARYGPADYSQCPPTGATTRRCAQACDVTERQWLRWAQQGWVGDRRADKLATRFGLHPDHIWAGWDHITVTIDDEDLWTGWRWPREVAA